MAKVIIFAMLLSVIGAITGSAAAADEQLFTVCAPMDIFVEPLHPEGSQNTGLTREAIMDAVESRLRAARLFATSEKQVRQQYLRINVNILGFAFSIGVELYRYLDNLGYGIPGYAAVWEAGTVGTHGNNGQYILGSVSRHLDKFIASYLRVNELHCSK